MSRRTLIVTLAGLALVILWSAPAAAEPGKAEAKPDDPARLDSSSAVSRAVSSASTEEVMMQQQNRGEETIHLQQPQSDSSSPILAEAFENLLPPKPAPASCTWHPRVSCSSAQDCVNKAP